MCVCVYMGEWVRLNECACLYIYVYVYVRACLYECVLKECVGVCL